MSAETETHGPAVNTDREIWREREGDFYAPSIHVTEGGGIGINCDGSVIVKPVREWHALSLRAIQAEEALDKIEDVRRDAAMRMARCPYERPDFTAKTCPVCCAKETDSCRPSDVALSEFYRLASAELVAFREGAADD